MVLRISFVSTFHQIWKTSKIEADILGHRIFFELVSIRNMIKIEKYRYLRFHCFSWKFSKVVTLDLQNALLRAMSKVGWLKSNALKRGIFLQQKRLKEGQSIDIGTLWRTNQTLSNSDSYRLLYTMTDKKIGDQYIFWIFFWDFWKHRN